MARWRSRSTDAPFWPPCYASLNTKPRSHNFIRLWRWEQSKSQAAGGNFHLCMTPQPWLRSGSAAAKDRDPRFDLERFDEAFLDRLRDRVAAAGGPPLEWAPFRATFDLLTVQRKLKDAGRFVFIDRVKKNPGFLPSIPASLRYVREAFARRPDMPLAGVFGLLQMGVVVGWMGSAKR